MCSLMASAVYSGRGLKRTLGADLADMTEPLQQLGDRSGVRATVYYLEDVDRVESAARDLFEVVHVEEKLDALQYHEVGYLGRHIDLRLRSDDPEHAKHPEQRCRTRLGKAQILKAVKQRD